MTLPVATTSGLRAWTCIGSVALLAITGEVLVAGSMRKLGDLDIIRAHSGMPGAIRAVLSSPMFVTGALCMALNFFSMLYTLSIVDYSLAGPASASLTYIGNAFAAMLFLRENVDRRRWLAACFVIVGVVLLSR
jgi:drug/metabolite transporter (DMT)-like permease